jgi:hypothetical protein
MGLCVGTINWTPSNSEEDVKKFLYKLMTAKYPLLAETHPNMKKYVLGKNSFGVKIGGFNLWWNGAEDSKDYIRSFLSDAESKLIYGYNLKDVGKDVQYLPM